MKKRGRSKALRSNETQSIGRKKLDIIIPCHNEAATLSANIQKILQYVDTAYKDEYVLTIVDSGSTDDTLQVAQQLARESKQIRVVRAKQSGRGLALRLAITSSRADVVAYMDEDLSTEISDLQALLAPLTASSKLIAIGGRFHKQSQVKRSWIRRITSVGYSYLSRLFLRIGVKDFQCGFKAMPTTLAKELLPEVQSDRWFFDTELLFVAKRRGVKLQEIPVTWQESGDSRVVVPATIMEFLAGLNRLSRQRSKILNVENAIILTLVAMMAALLIPTLSSNGWANTYYSAAAQSATQSWKAFLYGGFDAAGFITVDKPPLAIWISALSARVFGFTPFAVLLPHALLGLASLVILYKMVRRYFGTISAIVASLFFLLTPIVVVAFRYNNPDALLTLLLLASLAAFLRSLEKYSPFWLAFTGVMIGLGFMTKMLQALVVLPIFVAIYFAFARRSRLQRLGDIAIAAGAFLVSALWWPILVSLTPAASRPFIGGTANNSIWELILGYNGLNRLTGQNWYQPTGQTLGAGFGGKVGVLRFFNESFGSVVAWGIPIALLASYISLRYVSRKTDRLKWLAVLTWVGFLLMNVIVISFTRGTIHPHYAVVIAPAVAALVGFVVWAARWLLERKSTDSPIYMGLIVVLCFGAALMPLQFWKGRAWPLWIAAMVVGLAVVAFLLYAWAQTKGKHKLQYAAFVLALIALFAAPTASSIATARDTQRGFIVSATPLPTDIIRLYKPETGIPPALERYLLDNRGQSTWIASSITSYDAAAVQLTTGKSAMAIGGFSGVDNPLSVNDYKALVEAGKLRFFIVNRLQSSEVTRCGVRDNTPESKERIEVAKKNNCQPDPTKLDERSTHQISLWAQQHQEIKQKEFGAWEVFDLTKLKEAQPD